jgi:hypothetical protein
MTEPLTKTREVRPASLVGEIVNDLQIVGELQFQLVRASVLSELKLQLWAISLISLGGCMLGLFAILTSISLVYLLHWFSSPPSVALERIPLWACFAITAAGIALAGLSMILVGLGRFRKRIQSTPYLPSKDKF